MRAMSDGISLDDTEMIPRPPTAITGSVSASSPERTTKSFGTELHTSQICDMLPDASLTATIPGTELRRTSVETSTLHPVLPGTL